jgi:carboxymethylenebutenolidase
MYCLLMLLLLLTTPVIPNDLDSTELKRLCTHSDSICVTGLLEIPHTKGLHPAVIILHGAAGFDQRYAGLARFLADSGFVTLALDYYAEVGPSPISSEEKLKKWPGYQLAIRNAVKYLSSLKNVSEQRIGLVGFSRGAFLAVSVAASIPSVKAVVDFFGGGGGGTEPLEKEVQGLPPLLILHGENDRIVPLRFAHDLEDAVKRARGKVELQVYTNEGHGLSQATLPDAFRKMVKFLNLYLEE